MKSLTGQRNRLWNINPRCEKCGVVTILPIDVPGACYDEAGLLHIKNVPDNMATIQHKYDKLHPMRQENRSAKKRERRRFLWCIKCNREHWEKHEKQRALLNANRK